VKTLFAIVMTLGLLAGAAFGQPTITQVSNAASQALPPLQNSSIAQGSYFSIYGNGLAADISTCGANYANCLWPPTYPLPTSVQDTSVKVTVNGTTVDAYIEFAAQITSTLAQVNAVLPSNTPTGNGTLTVTYKGSTSSPYPVGVVSNSFGTFAINQAGTGPGIITDANYNVLTPFHTAKPGDYVILWGTGLGPVDASTEGSAPPTQTNLCGSGDTCPVTVWVANEKAFVAYAGRAAYTAEDEIVFIVPSDVSGCYVQVSVQIGSVVGNFTSMAVDPNGAACQDADGINYADIQSAVTSNGKVSVNVLDLLSNYLNLEILGAPFQWDNDTVSGEIGTFTTAVLDEFQGFALVPSVNNCTVSPFLEYPPPVDPALGLVTYLDAGSQLSITGPQGTQTVPHNTNGKGYGAIVGGASIADLLSGGGINPFFLNASGWGTSSWQYQIVPGNYSVSGPGGADVGAFNATITVPSGDSSFSWNQSSFSSAPISRNTPLTITWTGGDPNGFVDITAIGSTLASGLTPSATTPGILVECIAPTSTGHFTIPTYVLQTLPNTTASTAATPPGELLVGPASGATKLTAPSGTSVTYVIYHFIGGINVGWQ